MIRPQVLVTSAHCVTPLEELLENEHPFWITFKQYSLLLEDPYGIPAEDDEAYLPILKFVPHPDYQTKEDTHDIALVFLEVPVPDGIYPQDLPSKNYMDRVLNGLDNGQADLELTIVGYGCKEDSYLYDVNLMIGDNAIRRIGFVTFRNLTEYQIKTYQADDYKTCRGDSGAPIVHWNEDDGKEGMVGVRGGGGGPTHSRLDTKVIQNWIDPQINN